MELIKGTTQQIKASFPATATGFSANVTDEDGTAIGGTLTPTFEDGICTLTVPYSVVMEEGNYKAAIHFTMESQQFTRNIFFHVATPYLELWEVRKILEDEENDDVSDEECLRVEAAARFIVNAHCGQEFGYARKTIKVVGENGLALQAPERVISIDKVTAGDRVVYDVSETIGDSFRGAGSIVITGSGWFLKQPEGFTSTWEGEWESSDPIIAPPVYGRGYKNDVTYTLEGIFGYEEVPPSVKEAMKLLVNDYACAEQMYRDRFLSAITAADWRLQYYSGAYYKTGNARANLLLSPYVQHRLKVI